MSLKEQDTAKSRDWKVIDERIEALRADPMFPKTRYAFMISLFAPDIFDLGRSGQFLIMKTFAGDRSVSLAKREKIMEIAERYIKIRRAAHASVEQSQEDELSDIMLRIETLRTDPLFPTSKFASVLCMFDPELSKKQIVGKRLISKVFKGDKSLSVSKYKKVLEVTSRYIEICRAAHTATLNEAEQEVLRRLKEDEMACLNKLRDDPMFPQINYVSIIAMFDHEILGMGNSGRRLVTRVFTADKSVPAAKREKVVIAAKRCIESRRVLHDVDAIHDADVLDTRIEELRNDPLFPPKHYGCVISTFDPELSNMEGKKGHRIVMKVFEGDKSIPVAKRKRVVRAAELFINSRREVYEAFLQEQSNSLEALKNSIKVTQA